MNQMVNEPTRGQNTLDLLMTTNPELVSKIEVHPGMSDYQVVIANIDMKAKTSKKKPRLVHLFKKGDMNGLKENIQDKFGDRMNNMEENTVEENWTYFKKIILQATKEFISQKTIGSKQHVPWISTHIKRLIRRRQRRYNAAKKHNTKRNWNKYKQMRDLNNIAEHVIDSKGKSEILNTQYDSVFTTEDTKYMPNMGTNTTPYIRKLYIRSEGVEKQLKHLDPTKANGPDELPTRILIEAHCEIAPFLTKIYEQSYDSGEVPEDWRQANITAIYKKGDRSQAVNYRNSLTP
ncbi:unnamed protein product [Mytilus coruscus]|uniref:Uncharacterized protein n=1 Tax=Mytilus coruscus TaxID=42192 RepID=A0A6J8DFK2_MYTCO|nr:unnamed protein product [Mytilus coruscus]